MISRAIFLLALLAALILPALVERVLLPDARPAGAQALQPWPASLPRPVLRRLTCDARSCTVAWEVVGDGRWGAALIAPASGALLQDVQEPGAWSARIVPDDWRPGEPLVVLEWGEGWERRTRWAPSLMYFPRVEG